MLNEELGISFQNLNNSFAANTAGLAIGSFFLLPIVHKYGRRPVYIVSLLVQFAAAVWFAKMTTNWENIFINVFVGIFGAISEAMVQMTVADIFFVHQRATANAIYLFCVSIGAFLAPVAAGYSAAAQGWRWIWWWCAIFIGANLITVIFLFEETKYSVTYIGEERRGSVTQKITFKDKEASQYHGSDDSPTETPHPTFAPKTYRQRMRLITKTNTPVLRHTYQPLILLFTFPAVAYASLMWGALLAWFSAITTSYSIYLYLPPYNFGPQGVGLMSLAPFVGTIVATITSGPITDWWILRMAKRNGGIFEPEMRLHMALPGVLFCPIGLFMYGLCLAKGYSWPILAVGCGIFGFGFGAIGDISYTYLVDCYQDVTGDCFVAVAFVRNGIATAFVFGITPWIEGVGLYAMFATIGGISIVIFLLTIPMIIFGKRARKATAERYKKYALLQPNTRIFDS